MKILLRFLLCVALVIGYLAEGKNSYSIVVLYVEALPFALVSLFAFLDKSVFHDYVTETQEKMKLSYFAIYGMIAALVATLLLTIKVVFLYYLQFELNESIACALLLAIALLVLHKAYKYSKVKILIFIS